MTIGLWRDEQRQDAHGALVAPKNGAIMTGSAPVDEDDPEIIDISQCRTGDQLIAKSPEKCVGVIVGQHGSRIKPKPAGPLQRVGADHGTCHISTAVNAIRISGKRMDA